MASVKIVPYQDEYQSATLEFLKSQSGDHPELFDPQLFKWQRCTRQLAMLGDKIVGHMARISQPYSFRGETITLNWGATLVVDTSNSLVQVFAGTKLLEAVEGGEKKRFAAIGVVPEIETTHTRRGYVISRNDTRMYARFFNPSRALKYIGKPSYWSAPLGAMNLILRSSSASGAGELEPINRFEAGWDQIWNGFLSDEYRFYGIRDAEFLNYKLSQPGKAYQTYLYRDREGQIGGYIVFREAVNRHKDIKLTKICDLVGSAEAKGRLIGKALQFARESKCDGIVGLSSSRDSSIFRSCGLWVAKGYPVVLPPDLNEPIHITFFDSDLDHLW